jgi:hypothetical protein
MNARSESLGLGGQCQTLMTALPLSQVSDR